VKKIYLLIDNGHYFGHHLIYDKVNVNFVVNYFYKKNIDVKVLNLKDITNNVLKLEDSIVFTVSSQKPYHKFFLNDINEYLTLKGNILIPSNNMIKAHENKGFQELYKNIIGIKSLNSIYCNYDTISYENISQKFKYPLVLKKLDGSGSKGVQLIYNEHELKESINKKVYDFKYRSARYVYEKLKNIFTNSTSEKLKYYSEYNNYIIQEFVPNLEFDYKVLIFGEKYYVLKRNIKKGDFRASGSGNFEFVDIENDLLNYANDLFNKFNEPFISFDICFDGDKYYLIEYQGIHFGPYTQLFADGYYYKVGNSWKFLNKRIQLDEVLASSLYLFMQNNKIL